MPPNREKKVQQEDFQTQTGSTTSNPGKWRLSYADPQYCRLKTALSLLKGGVYVPPPELSGLCAYFELRMMLVPAIKSRF